MWILYIYTKKPQVKTTAVVTHMASSWSSRTCGAGGLAAVSGHIHF